MAEQAESTPAPTSSEATSAAATTIEPIVRRWRDLDVYQILHTTDRETHHARLHRRKVFFLLAILLTLMGIFAGMMSWVHPLTPPYYLPLFITEYESRQIPVNDQANPDREALRDGGYFSRTDENAFASQERDMFLQELVGLKNRSVSDSLVLYLSAFACGDSKGGVALFLADVNPDMNRTRMPLREVLQQVTKTPARKKLLILDIMRPLARTRLGVLEDDVSTLVLQDLEAVPDPRRLVLCSCSPGQVSQSSEELGRSVFGYYLEEALRGWADGYNARAERDSRVSVHELAEFVRLRVDRWAVRNRNTRQTPVLYGSAPNFQLVALEHGKPQPPLDVPEATVIPPWLLTAWKQRDQWRSSRLYRNDPRLFLQMEHLLLMAEQQWRGGVDATRVKNDLKERMDHYQTLFEQVNALIPMQPQPHSLALAVAQGQKPDPAVSAAFNELLISIKQQTVDVKPDEANKVRQKLLQGFQDKFKPNPYFDFAWAAFELAAADINPAPDTIRLLDQILQQKRQQKPTYAETLFLWQLARLADQLEPDAWPMQTVRVALATVQKGEQAVVHPRVVPWVHGLLLEAAQKRYDGEVLLFARGYAPLESADQVLRSASEAYDLILSFEATIEEAQNTRDFGLAFLPWYVTYLEKSPSGQEKNISDRNTISSGERIAREAIQAVKELDLVLRPPAAGTTLSVNELRGRSEIFRLKTETLKNSLDDLRWSFDADQIAALINQTKQPEVTASAYLSIQAILDTPYLKTEDRSALWQARQDLGRRLLDMTFAMDAQDDALRQMTPGMSDYSAERPRFEQRQRNLALLRSRYSLILMNLAELSPAILKELTEAIDGLSATPKKLDPDKPDPISVVGLMLRRAWSEQLPARLSEDIGLEAQDLLTWLLLPFESVPLADQPRTNPTVRMRAQEARTLWGWMVNFFHYRSRDLEGSSFYSEASIEYQRQADPVPETFVQITSSPVPALNNLTPTVTCTLMLTLFTASPTSQLNIELGIVTADGDWLQVTPESKGLKTLMEAGPPIRSCKVPLKIELKRGAELSRVPRPKGFLVEVKLDGRTFHHKVAVPALPLPLSERLDLLLSADPAAPATVVDGELRLRPIQSPLPYYLFVRNTTSKPRNVLVQLKSNNALLKGGEAKLTADANAVKPVNFTPPPPAAPPAAAAAGAPPPAPAPSGELPEFNGPLQLVLLDAANPTDVLDVKELRVGIASPREYVQVSQILFSPPSPKNGGKNLLLVKLRAVAPIVGPPCMVHLVLPPDRIPGFISAKDGNFSGILPSGGQELTLYASNVQLEEGAKLGGYVYLTVDGLERAFIFRTTFSRQGEPTSPREDDRPALRIRANHLALSSSKFALGVEVDNPPPKSSLQVSLGQDIDGAFESDLMKKVASARRHYVGFAPSSPSGALLFEAAIQDWNVPLNTSGIRGRRKLDVFLLDFEGAEILEAQRYITLDDSPPESVRILNLPAKALPTAALVLQASGNDNESGIAKVSFFVGKPVDGKLPPALPTFPAEPVDAGKTIWSAKMVLAGDKKGPTEIGVEFVNGVGLSTYASGTIDLEPEQPPKTGPGKIQGKVVEGDRPQPGLIVTLSDDKGKEKAKTKTKPDGTYLFDEVAPGAYKVAVTKVSSNRVANAEVVVPPLETATANLDLLYK